MSDGLVRLLKRTCPNCGARLSNKNIFKGSDAGPPGTKTVATAIGVCPYCGHAVKAKVVRIRSNPRGVGAHYSGEITDIGRARSICLVILNQFKAYNFESRFGLTEIWKKIQRFCLDTGNNVPTKGGTSGRLSELQGMGLVSSGRNEIVLTDTETMAFRHANPQRWFLTEAGRIDGAN